MRREIRRSVCAAAAALLLCTSCGAAEESAKPGSAPDETTASKPAAEQASEQNDNGSGETERPVYPPSEDTLTGFANFAAGLLKSSCGEDIRAGKNVLVSPESALMALGMAATGARGLTYDQMGEVMQGDGDLVKMEDALKYLTQDGGESGVKINRANSMWVNEAESVKINKGYVDAAAKGFGSEFFSMPFDDKTADEINDWVKDETKGMIPGIIDEIPPNTFMYLINATAFEAEWSVQYEDGDVLEEMSFVNAAGEQETCTMLSSKENTYLNDGSAQAFIRPYSGGKYAFMGILPDEGVSVSDYIGKLDGESWYKLWNSRTYEEVNVLIPEFTFDYDKELSDGLKDMGITAAFDPAQADFSAMTEDGSSSLYISRVLHKTHIELDRKGTKAAAATAVEMQVKGMEQPAKRTLSIELDRPFVYAIVDTETGFPMFIGAVNTVAKA